MVTSGMPTIPSWIVSLPPSSKRIVRATSASSATMETLPRRASKSLLLVGLGVEVLADQVREHHGEAVLLGPGRELDVGLHASP